MNACTHQPADQALPVAAFPQVAINAMNLEQQLSQYAIFNQQPETETHQSQAVSYNTSLCPHTQPLPKGYIMAVIFLHLWLHCINSYYVKTQSSKSE